MRETRSTRRNRSYAGIITAIALLALGLVSLPSRVDAHTMADNGQDKGTPNGIAIAPIAHSDMEVLAAYRPEIIALAERQTQTDERFRRLLNFSKIQYTYCLWGIVPGALSDEESDFNACSHAYLASAWALLQHMQEMPSARKEAVPLRHSVDAALAAVPAVSLCASSDEIFHTDRIIVPPGAYAAAGGLSGLLLLAGVLPFLWANNRSFG
ncbi:hypothetical protein D9M68_260760 [compost metagenome]